LMLRSVGEHPILGGEVTSIVCYKKEETEIDIYIYIYRERERGGGERERFTKTFHVLIAN